MDVSKKYLLGFLEGTRQFTLPIFQRRYSWEKRQCEQLWDDIVRVGTDDNTLSYFLGSIVFMPETSAAASKSRVIDGQQRLTTVSLLLSALGRLIEAKNIDIPIDRSRLEGYYLFNEREEGELRYKQLLTKHDKDALIQLLENGTVSNNSSLLNQNYLFFYDKLRRANIGAVYRGIQKLEIVSIALDPQDNPQLIFESLNSKGLDLSQADLIRNYVLMGQEPNFQDRLYENYWYPMERSFGAEYTTRFDLFIRDYLTLKTQQIPGRKKVYESFKRYVGDNNPPEALEAVVNEIYHYSEHYVHMVLHAEPDRELRACFKDIHTPGVEVVYPFLLGVYEDYIQNRLKKTEVVDILRLVESYVFRRAICNLQSRDLNNIFATLMGQIDKTDYLQSLKNAFAITTVTQRFPSDDEFQDKFLIRDVYNLKGRSILRSYLLGKLENHERKEPIRVKDYTIEHVMPQRLTDEWEDELGETCREVHEKYLHTIGNLTLTGYNSELSNSTFIEKQLMEGGFLDSPLRLNTSFRDVERWDENAILKRARILVTKACKIWPHHGIVQGPHREHQQDYPHLTGEKKESYERLRPLIENLDDSVYEKNNKYYVVFGYGERGGFLRFHKWRKSLLFLKIPFSEIDDPRRVCQKGNHYKSWEVEINQSSLDDLDYIMFLIRQAFEKQVVH